ncbi:dicarboxylate/amino acid:cation symporter [Clostridium swellfunianum]|uniref:dicarboxylate/amino acid:cation symporter n=1 Tax=Clostridium swellfunianum TaxID=1367462 RepID=UPI00202F7C37|nr:dicarboxylate/amino acid:cation symporter [Clostridium swellfunianum]MCM0650333.1 dicarboxylate/amino acid:cation symporter [Clostridium swellfunianum]
MNLLKSYKSSLILLSSVIIGGLVGAIVGPKASIVEPLGDLFLNLMFMIIVPLVFFSVTSAIGNMVSMKRLGKILAAIFIVFTSTALLTAVISFIGALIMNPTNGIDTSAIKALMSKAAEGTQSTEKVGFLKQLVNTFTVSDFISLFSRKNMLQLIVFSVGLGSAIAMVKEKAQPLAKFLDAGASVMMKLVDIIMYYAPIGLGCYFASVVGQLGPQILQGYLKSFLLYLILTVVVYLGLFTLYAFIAGGKKGIKIFWENAITPSITALATCSSAACIPVNLEYVKKMGVTKDIAETVIPLGANTHKDGSVIGGVLKVTFLFGLFGYSMTDLKSALSIIFTAFLVGAVMGAIPGGGMIGEMLIISVYGFPPEVLPIIAVISTIIDAPATLLNSTGNTVCSMLVTRMVEGRLKFAKILASEAGLSEPA